MIPGFPKKELHLINLTLRMFTEPVLRLDIPLLQQHKAEIFDKKEALYDKLKIPRHEAQEVLLSNNKFAEALSKLGIEPPVKISVTTGKETLALAKNDEEFKALAEHPNAEVQALVAARLGVKSTLEETRTDRFIGIASRGTLPVPVKYYAAHTGRWGGDDKINLQNLPSRGVNAGKLKLAIKAPPGHKLIDADSSQIEARVLAWLAGQNDLVAAFAKGEDVYRIMASAIYGKKAEDITKDERFVGKTTILGAGYGMGAVKFQAQLKTFGVTISLEEARRIIDVYRRTYPKIAMLWKQAQQAIVHMSRGEPAVIGRSGVIKVIPKDRAIMLPSGLLLRYDELRADAGENGVEFTYKTRRGRTRIYGGKAIENVCQGIARCIIGEQMLRISKKYRVVLTVHDAIACVVLDKELDEARQYVEDCMRWTPDWAAGLPVNCESGHGVSYGEC
jgi:DNA polymerase